MRPRILRAHYFGISEASLSLLSRSADITLLFAT
jgi:hypothetical protein